MSKERVVRAVVHFEAKVLSDEEEAGFFLAVGDHCSMALHDFLFDRVEVVDQVALKKKHPTTDSDTARAAESWRKRGRNP